MKTIIRNASIVNEGKIIVADVLLANSRIEKTGLSIDFTNTSF
jgi:dihydroorotase-like cyclic amidohydrolase